MDLKALRNAIRTTPIVDNHAHPLLKVQHQFKHSLLSIATEAHGDALGDSQLSLAHIRAVKQLAGLLDTEPTWDAVESALHAKRSSPNSGTDAGGWTAWVRSCMQGIETLLLDDGLDSGDETHEYAWHDQFVTGKCKRIVRIEALAVDIIRRHVATAGRAEQWGRRAVLKILGDFEREIGRCLADPEVVGFKSIICYRGGLDIPSKRHMETQTQIQAAEEEIGSIAQGGEFTRLQHKALNHFLIHAAAKLIANGSGSETKKPIQFHTGLGDNDIILTKSSPSHLQTFIADYPTVPIVILHASYPWTREAGYLAAMYPNVYADVGEVFPFISRQGQESVFKQILELCPWSKILWSTDGHWFPETYVLATMQMRDVLETTLCDLVHEGDLNEHQAIQLAQDILFTNSKRLYNLQTETTLPKPESISTTTLVKSQSGNKSSSSRPKRDVAKLLHETGCKWVRLVWVDYTASTRCRVIPVKQVLKALHQNGGNGSWTNTMAAFGLLQIDMPIPQITSTGMYKLAVDWASLRAGPAPGHMSCFSEFREPDGLVESPLCPRTLLRRVVERARASHGLTFLLGFEIEFVVMERNDQTAQGDATTTTTTTAKEKFRPLQADDGHAWAMARSLADTGRPGSFNTVLDGELADALDAAGIEIEQYHAESAPGQYEIVLSPLPPLEACDALVHARQLIESVAARHGFRATLHPKPFAASCGTASHVHMSVASDTPGGEDNPEVYEPFYAGILRHFPAVIAFTYSSPVSYERMVDSFWAGGRWIMWGRQNKEAPLRQCGGEPGSPGGPTSHWEMKCLDGLANPYFAAAAILSAGTLGVADQEPMVWKDCSSDPAKLTPEQREELGITQMFPADLGEALAALQADTALIEQMGSPEFVQRYVDVKNAEMGILSQLGESERRQWIMERY
ncbi:extracellular developmental signal biosynthesis protein FluG [Apiospora marii]|uniref:Glutamine synthetase n=1 Tax=Apiospora marii TaxID=335849 RepID=A0ABR1SU49_9PEZI